MKIAMISEHASPLATICGADAGGQNVHVAALAAALMAGGNEIDVYTRSDGNDLPPVVTMPSGVKVRHLAAGPAKYVEKDRLLPFMGEFAKLLGEAFARERYAIAHAHFWMSGMATLAAARAYRVPVVQTYHALGVEKKRHQASADTSPSGRIERELAIAREADRIIATSSSEVFELIRLGAEASKLKIVPCGVDVAFFDARNESYMRPRKERYRIVTLSRLVARKGVGDVIRSLIDLPDTELLIGGGAADGSYDAEAASLHRIAGEAGVAERVAFVGPVARDDVPRFLRAADVAVCAAWYEPFGLVPLEAMACRVPVVATAVGGQNDTVIDGSTGYHVQPRSPRALAASISALLGSRTLRVALGLAGRRRVEERYTWSRIARETERIYRDVSRATIKMDITA